MKNCIILSVILAVFTADVNSQSEIKVYGGVLDRPGLSLEQSLSKKIGLELGASYRYKTFEYLFLGSPSDHRENNLFVNAFFKRYTNINGKQYFFYGAYLRYWQNYHYKINVDQLTNDQRINVNMVTHSTKTHKISYGFLAGFKFPIASRFTLGMNTGIGFSSTKTYWKEEERYYAPRIVQNVGRSEWFGYWTHLSGVGHLSFGYRFGKQLNEK
jgi:hypothetical protein